MNLPVDFDAKVKSGKGASGTGYPAQISAADLMKNFVHAALEADETLIEKTTGQGGYSGRKLKFPAAPTTGTHILGVKDGTLQWLATEEC